MVKSCILQVGPSLGLPGWQGPETLTDRMLQTRMSRGVAWVSKVPGMVSQVSPLSREYFPV